MVSARRQKCSLLTVALRQLKAKHAMVEADRAIQVGDLEVNVPNTRLRVNQTGISDGRHCEPPFRSPRKSLDCFARDLRLYHAANAIPNPSASWGMSGLLRHHAH